MPKVTKKREMPNFTNAPPEMVKLFVDAVGVFPQVTQRKMFGYPAAFVNGNMTAGLFQEDMFLRLSDFDRAEFRKEYRTRLFEPMPGRPMRGYVLVPRTVIRSQHLLHEWLEKAIRFTATLPPKASRAKASK